jgi:trk system potassium uptake protein TrkA
MFILIVGGGKVGFNLAYILSREDKQEVVVIDKSKDVLEKFKELAEVKTIHGDGTDPRVLETVGITRANAVVAVTGSDVDNLALSMIAKRQFGVKRMIARVNNIKNQWLYTRERGVDYTIAGALFIAKVIHEEVSLTDLITLLKIGGGEFSLVEEQVPQTSQAIGKSVADLNIPEGIVLTAIIRGDKIVLPRGETVVGADDKVLALAESQKSHLLEEILSGSASS